MARCLAGHETANTDFCDVCGARVNGIPGSGLDRGAGRHRGPDRGTASDGRICPGCGASAPGQFCDACGLRIRVRSPYSSFGPEAEEFPGPGASSGPPESLFPPIDRPGASSSPWGPAESPSPWNSPSPPAASPPAAFQQAGHQAAPSQQAQAQQSWAQQAWAQQAPAEPAPSWSRAPQQAQAEPPAPWNLPAEQSAPWNLPAEPQAPWNTPAEQASPWGQPPAQARPAESRPQAQPGSSGDTGAFHLLESLFSPEPSAASPATPTAPAVPPAPVAPAARPAAQPPGMTPPAAPAQASAPAQMAPPPAAPPLAEPAAPARTEPPAPVAAAPAPAARAVPASAAAAAPAFAASSGPAAPPTRPIPALAVAWTVLIASDRAYYDMMKSVRDQRGPDVAFPVHPAQRRIRLTGDQMRIGRRSATRELEPEIDLAEQPVDPGVSRLHAVLLATPDGNWSILDPGSANGTLLNGREIPAGERIPLHEGDRINLGAWTVISMHRS